MKKIHSICLSVLLACLSLNVFAADEEEFVPAYQNEGKYQLEDPNKYSWRRDRLVPIPLSRKRPLPKLPSESG